MILKVECHERTLVTNKKNNSLQTMNNILQHKPIAPKFLQDNPDQQQVSQYTTSSSASSLMMADSMVSSTVQAGNQNRGGGNGSGGGGARRKIAFMHPTLGYPIAAPLPAKVARRNARERNRVKQVSIIKCVQYL